MTIQAKKSILWGMAGWLFLLILYFLILTIANSFAHSLDQLKNLWYWLLPLIMGFSIQVGLYAYIRLEIKQRAIKSAAKAELAATGGVSTGSMVACCAHHLVDILPILGLSAAFVFLAQYQVWFIVLGILSNLIGIVLMLEIIKKHSLFQADGILNKIAKLNIKKLRNSAIVISVLLLLLSFFLIRNKGQETVVDLPASEPSLETFSLLSKTNDGGGLAIEAAPIDFSFDQPLQFKISLNTHQGDLDFDLTKQTVLIDDQGQEYQPLEWQGGRGGHHLSGILVFPAASSKTNSLTLKIFDVYNVPEREFWWEL